MGITKDNFDAIKPENYTLLYVGELSELQKETQGATLEAIFEKFNLDHPEDFRGHSLSVSDIVVLHQNGQNTAHFVEFFLDIRKYRIFYGSRHRKRKKCRTLLDTMSKRQNRK